MKESWSTIKAFLGGWGSLVLGIGATFILLYIAYLIISIIFF